MLGFGLTLWSIGSIWQVLGELYGITVVTPGPADVLWLTVYPCTLVTFAALARPWLRSSGHHAGARRDDARARLRRRRHGGRAADADRQPGPISGGAQLVTLAYPVGDTVLLSVALIGAAVAGWRAGAVWRLLAIGASCSSAATSCGRCRPPPAPGSP